MAPNSSTGPTISGMSSLGAHKSNSLGHKLSTSRRKRKQLEEKQFVPRTAEDKFAALGLREDIRSSGNSRNVSPVNSRGDTDVDDEETDLIYGNAYARECSRNEYIKQQLGQNVGQKIHKFYNMNNVNSNNTNSGYVLKSSTPQNIKAKGISKNIPIAQRGHAEVIRNNAAEGSNSPAAIQDNNELGGGSLYPIENGNTWGSSSKFQPTSSPSSPINNQQKEYASYSSATSVSTVISNGHISIHPSSSRKDNTREPRIEDISRTEYSNAFTDNNASMNTTNFMRLYDEINSKNLQIKELQNRLSLLEETHSKEVEALNISHSQDRKKTRDAYKEALSKLGLKMKTEYKVAYSKAVDKIKNAHRETLESKDDEIRQLKKDLHNSRTHNRTLERKLTESHQSLQNAQEQERNTRMGAELDIRDMKIAYKDNLQKIKIDMAAWKQNCIEKLNQEWNRRKMLSDHQPIYSQPVPTRYIAHY